MYLMRKLLDKGILWLILLSFSHLQAQHVNDTPPVQRDLPNRSPATEKNLQERSDTEHAIRLNQLRWQRNFFLAVSIVLLLIFFQTFNRSRKTLREGWTLNRENSRLEQLNRSKDQLFAIISHDLRSALHALGANISRIRTLFEQSMTEEARQLLENTGQISASTQSLLNNLLYWSMSQTGQVSFQFEQLALKPLIEQVCYDFRPIAASKKISLLDLVDYPFTCLADANALKIILRNLIDNALKYTAPQGSVIITAQQDEQRCRITVTDSGIGMDEETVAAVLDTGPNRVQSDAYGRRSTGLGLWLVKSLVATNSGEFSVLSEKGIGTHITITLPAR